MQQKVVMCIYCTADQLTVHQLTNTVQDAKLLKSSGVLRADLLEPGQ